MKNMGLRELVLVKPKLFPDPEATARASGADDVLAQARVVETLAEALEGVGFVVGDHVPGSRPELPRARCARVRPGASSKSRASRLLAVLFGAERTGHCRTSTSNRRTRSSAFRRIQSTSRLNVAMAVQLVTYEIYREVQEPAVADMRTARARHVRSRWSACYSTLPR